MRQERDAERLVFVNVHRVPCNGDIFCAGRMDFLPAIHSDVLESRSSIIELRSAGQRLLEAR